MKVVKVIVEALRYFGFIFIGVLIGMGVVISLSPLKRNVVAENYAVFFEELDQAFERAYVLRNRSANWGPEEFEIFRQICSELEEISARAENREYLRLFPPPATGRLPRH